LTGAGVDLNEALRLYALSFATQRGFTKIAPPLFMSKEYMAKTAQLEQFDEELYGVKDGDPQNDKYLIATSEQPISAYFANEWWQAKDLPVKYIHRSSRFGYR
jgi:seryl-tRNA synthetase